MTPADSRRRGRVRHRATAYAALAANAVMMLAGMCAFAVDGRGFWTLPTLIAVGIHGGAASSGAAFAVAIVSGLAVHAAIALAIGFLFAVIINFVTHEFLWTGLVLGFGSWALNATLISMCFPQMRAAMAAAPASDALFAHAAFGCTLALLARRNVVMFAQRNRT